MDNWGSGFAEADIDDEFDEDFGYEQEYDEGEDGEAGPAIASSSSRSSESKSSSAAASKQPAERLNVSSVSTSTNTNNTATSQMSAYATEILNKPMAAILPTFDEPTSSSSASSMGDQYKSTLSEALNGGGRWRSAGAAPGQQRNANNNKRARRTAVAAATISGGSGGIGGVTGGKTSGGGGGMVPGVGFALATRLALQPKRLDAKAYGAFDRPPLEETVMCTLANGNRLYVPLASSNLAASSSSSSSSASADQAAAPPSSLLAVPMADLRDEVNHLRLAQAAVQRTTNDDDVNDGNGNSASKKPAVAMNAATAAAALPASALVLMHGMAGSEVETNKLQGAHTGVQNEPGENDGNDEDDRDGATKKDGEADSDSDLDTGKEGTDEDDNDDDNGAEINEKGGSSSGSGGGSSSGTGADAGASSKRGVAPLAANGRNDSGSKELWVQKYAPKHFSELLSAEALNRGVLHALKAWDAHVFKTPTEEARSHESAASAGLFGAAKAVADKALRDDRSASKQANNNAMEDDDDESSEGSRRKVDQRPRVRIVLLCGPPGTGKTTLAHVAARHAGYAPREINASDDRSAEALREGVTRAMESQSMFGDKKPNCVILDEIDGADAKGAIQAVVDMAKAPLRPKHHKKGGATPLTRPLVCICNDPFAPHLRPLREVALTFHFKGTPENRLLSRLKYICKAEAQNAAAAQAQALNKAKGGGKSAANNKSSSSISGTLGDMNASALSALCAATGNDMRSSINILQFVSMRKATLALDDVTACPTPPNPSSETSSSTAVLPPPPPSSSSLLLRTLEAGIKDERHDLLEVLTTVFWRKKATTSSLAGSSSGAQAAQRLRGAAISEAASNNTTTAISSSTTSSSSTSGLAAGGRSKTTTTTVNSTVSATMASAANHGEHALIALGIYENFGSIAFRDPWMVKTAELLDWLAWQSTLQRRVDEDQQYALLGLMPAAAAAAHCLCSSDLRPPKLQRPQEWRKRQQISDQRRSILQSFVDGAQLQPPSQQHNNINNMNSSEGSTSNGDAATAAEKGGGRTCVDRSTSVAVLDVIPHLLTVLSPEIRGSVNPDLFTPQEKAAMAQSIEVLGAYGLSYGPSFVENAAAAARHTNLGNGEVPYQLLPEIDLLVSFEAQNSNSNGSNAPSYNKPNNKGAAAATTSEWTTDVEKALARNVRRAPGVANLVPNSVRVAIAREVAINKLRRQEAARQDSEGSSAASSSSSTPSSAGSASKAAASTSKALAATASTAKATPAAAVAAAVEPTRKRDFFGNLVPESGAANSSGGSGADGSLRKVPKHEAEAAAAAAAAAVPIKYQFKKGFTNAIKRPVYMADFI